MPKKTPSIANMISLALEMPEFLKGVRKGKILFHVNYGEVIVTDNNNKGVIKVRDREGHIHICDNKGIRAGTADIYPSIYVKPFVLDKRMLRLPLSVVESIEQDAHVFVSNNGYDWEAGHFALIHDLYYIFPFGKTSFTSHIKDAKGFRYLKLPTGEKFYHEDTNNDKKSSYYLDFSIYADLLKTGYVLKEDKEKKDDV